MERVTKFKLLCKGTANATADISLINKYSKKELTPDDVYVFSVILCDNDIDCDMERFTEATLTELAPLFLGKTGIRDHRWSAEQQHSRIYRTAVETTTEKNAVGEPLIVLRADAYMLNTEENKPMIDAIDGGILKEVSIGCMVSKNSCSICGGALRYNWISGNRICENEHCVGKEYDGKLCFCELEDPTDAYEFSFVAVPAQKNAGVIKSVENVSAAIEVLKTSDLSGNQDELKELMPIIQMSFLASDERELRSKIAKKAKSNLEKGK